MPFIIKDNIDFLKKGNKYCLIYNSGFFGGQIRLGDFVMATNILYIIKQLLINKFSYLNQNNMFFIFNKKNKLHIKEFDKFIKHYPHLFLPDMMNNSSFMGNNVNQILKNGNI
jgi:hypothetical protein